MVVSMVHYVSMMCLPIILFKCLNKGSLSLNWLSNYGASHLLQIFLPSYFTNGYVSTRLHHYFWWCKINIDFGFEWLVAFMNGELCHLVLLRSIYKTNSLAFIFFGWRNVALFSIAVVLANNFILRFHSYLKLNLIIQRCFSVIHLPWLKAQEMCSGRNTTSFEWTDSIGYHLYL